jgi:hypothetical protein
MVDTHTRCVRCGKESGSSVRVIQDIGDVQFLGGAGINTTREWRYPVAATKKYWSLPPCAEGEYWSGDLFSGV